MKLNVHQQQDYLKLKATATEANPHKGGIKQKLPSVKQSATDKGVWLVQTHKGVVQHYTVLQYCSIMSMYHKLHF